MNPDVIAQAWSVLQRSAKHFSVTGSEHSVRNITFLHYAFKAPFAQWLDTDLLTLMFCCPRLLSLCADGV